MSLPALAAPYSTVFFVNLTFDFLLYFKIVGEIVEANPFGACTGILNSEDVEDRIVIAERGGCMFIDKVKLCLNSRA